MGSPSLGSVSPAEPTTFGSSAGPSGPVPPGVTPAITGSLSPSRASDFMTCPLRYRFRVIDRLPEPPSPAATRGTVVHTVLERLFDLPPAERTLPAAAALVAPAWNEVVERAPATAAMFDGADALGAGLGSA
ncbi:MAG: RecB family exonuclease, partial [Frankia sp.]